MSRKNLPMAPGVSYTEVAPRKDFGQKKPPAAPEVTLEEELQEAATLQSVHDMQKLREREEAADRDLARAVQESQSDEVIVISSDEEEEPKDLRPLPPAGRQPISVVSSDAASSRAKSQPGAQQRQSPVDLGVPQGRESVTVCVGGRGRMQHRSTAVNGTCVRAYRCTY